MLQRREKRKRRIQSEKYERGLMRVEDYDVTDLLAGYVELTDSEESEEEDSNIFDDDSFFEK
jgi:hypothetical protein